MKKPQEPRIVHIKARRRRWQGQYGSGTMLIATPRLVEGLMRKAAKGELLTTGIFARIVAEAANEEMNEGKKLVTPYWRLVRDDGALMEKFPGGVSAQAKLLRNERHIINPGQGKKPPRVKDFEKPLTHL
jgi:hypothetical protein